MFKLPIKQNRRSVLCVDADAFFSSVEQVLNPKLKGKPLLVGGPSVTHGIVSAASYEAKKFGIKSGMPMYLARKKCPQATVVSGNFEAYGDFSQRMYQIMTIFTPVVEMASIDEAYLDITGCKPIHGLEPAEIAKKLMFYIYKKLGLPVSCGLASNKTVAKVACTINKPHKLTVVPFGKERDFLAPLPLDEIPGIGPKTSALLEKHGLKKVCDLSKLSSEEVMAKLGIHGIPLWKRCLGFDDAPVIGTVSLPKSISKEHTFYGEVRDFNFCLRHLKKLAENVFSKLRSHRLRARTIFIRIRYKQWKNFEDYSFQRHIEMPTALDSRLFPTAKNLFLENVRRDIDIRLIGIGVSNLVQNYNLSLFENDEKEEKLFLEMDKLNRIYGDGVLRYGV